MKKQILQFIALLTVVFTATAVHANDEQNGEGSPAQLQQQPQRGMSVGEFSTKFVMQIENQAYSLFDSNKLSHGTGTGFIVAIESDQQTGRKIGVIFTNRHVIASIPYTKNRYDLHFSGPGGTKEHTRAKLVYESPLHDFAVLTFEMSSLSRTMRSHLMPAKLADPSSPFFDFEANHLSLRGQPVIALGNPLGTKNVTTFGQITGSDMSPTDGVQILTQTPINPGNSGGPLVTPDGTVVGINSAKNVGQDVDNMGFVIPIAKVIGEYFAWKKDPTIEQKTFLGAIFEDTDARTLSNLGVDNLINDEAPEYFTRHEGTLTVQNALPESNLQVGDQIFRINGKESGPFLYSIMHAKHYSKGSIKVDLVRNNSQILRNVEVPIVNMHESIEQSKKDLLSLSGLLLLERTSRENYLSFGDTKNRVWIMGFIPSNATNLHAREFPPQPSVIKAIRVRGEFQEIISIQQLKDILKSLPVNMKHLEIRVQMPVLIPTKNGYTMVPGMAGAPIPLSFDRTFTIPLTKVLMYPVLDINKFEKQFSFDEGDFNSRDFNHFLVEQQKACDALLNGATAAQDLTPQIEAPTANPGASLGFQFPPNLKTN